MNEEKQWRVIRDEEDEDELVNADFSILDQNNELVANVHGRTVGDIITNADLIASAPAMRRALHQIAHCDDLRYVGEDSSVQIEKRLKAAIELAESALGYGPPCLRCGRCGFIEDADMNLAGQCPECNGTGRALKSQREAAGTADEKPDGQAENKLLSDP